MKHNNINIYVFSGTGNTLVAAKKLAEVFDKNSYNAKVYRMEAVRAEEVNLKSTIGIGWTIAFWNTYPFVRQWLSALPDGNGAEVFLFSTMGDSSCGMIHHIAQMLEKKNYKIIGAESFLMPNNFLLVCDDKANKKKTDNTLLKIEKYAGNIMTEKEYKSGANFFTKAAFKVTNFIVLKMWYTKLLQKIMKFKTNKEKCIKCGICEKLCPVENINFSDEKFPVFKDKCLFCLRCVTYCPQKALSSKILLKIYGGALSLEEMLWKKQ